MNNDILEKARRIRNGETQNSEEVSNRVQAAHDLLASIKDQTVHNRNAHIADLIRQREQKESIARGQAMIDAQKVRDAQAEARNAHTASELDLAHGILPATSNAQAFANQRNQNSLDDTVNQIMGNNVLTAQGKVNQIGHVIQSRFGNQTTLAINTQADLGRAIRSEVSQNRQTNTAINNSLNRYQERIENERRLRDAAQKGNSQRIAAISHELDQEKERQRKAAEERNNDPERKKLLDERGELVNRLTEIEIQQNSGYPLPELETEAEDLRKRIAEYDAMLAPSEEADSEFIARQAMLSAQLDEAKAARYAAIPASPDFKEKSKYTFGNNAVSDRINGKKPDEYDPLTDVVDDYLDYFTDEQKGIYNYILNTQGEDEAQKYVENIRPELEEKATNQAAMSATEYGQRNAGTAMLGAAASVIGNPLRIAGTLGAVIDAAQGNNVRPNAFYNRPSVLHGAVRTGVNQRLAEDVSGLMKHLGASDETAQAVGSGAAWLNQGVLSSLDSAWNGTMGQWLTGAFGMDVQGAREILNASEAGATVDAAVLANAEKAMNTAENLTRIMVGMEVVPDAVRNAKARGYTDDQALAVGFMSGLAEWFSEAVSVGNLFETDWTEKGVKNFLLNQLKQRGFEGLEEIESSVITTVADALIAKDKSEWQEAIDKYTKDPNVGKKRAFGAALMEKGGEAMMEALSAFLTTGNEIVIEAGKQQLYNNYIRGTHEAVDRADSKNKTNYRQTIDASILAAMDKPEEEWASNLADAVNGMRGAYKGNTINRTIDYLREASRTATDGVSAANYAAMADYLSRNKKAVWQLAEERNGTAKQTEQNAQTETAPEQIAPSTAEVAPSTELTTPSIESSTPSIQATNPQIQATTAENQAITAENQATTQQTAQNASQTSEEAPVAENAVETSNNTSAENNVQRGSVNATESTVQNEPGYRPSERRVGAAAFGLSEDMAPDQAASTILRRVIQNAKDPMALAKSGVRKAAIDGLNASVNNAIQSGQYTAEEAEALKSYTNQVRDALRNSNDTLQKTLNATSAVLKKYGVKNIRIDETLTDARGYHKGDTIYVNPYLDTMQSVASVIAHETFHQARMGDKSGKLLDDIDKYYTALAGRSQNREDTDGQFSVSNTGGRVNLYTDAQFVRTYADKIWEEFSPTEAGKAALNAYYEQHRDTTMEEAIAAVYEADPEKFWSDYWKPSASGETARDYIREEKAANFIEQLAGTDGGALFRELVRDDRNLAQRIIDTIRNFLKLPAKERRFEGAEAYQRLADKFEKALADATGEEQQRAEMTAATADDIPDSGKFSLSCPVERVGDLIAVHNLTEDKYLSSHKLGGFPAPSIAVVKAKTGHMDYGPISVVFGSDTIDPKKDPRNRIYGGDAWTPTFPDVEYNINRTFVANVNNALYQYMRKLPETDPFPNTGKLTRYVKKDAMTNILSTLEWGDTVDTVIENASHNNAIALAYIGAKDDGFEVPNNYRTNQQLDQLIEDNAPVEEVKNWIRPIIEKITEENGIRIEEDRPNRPKKSFNETHVPVTAENVVRAMYQQQSRRGEKITPNAQGISSLTIPEYNSLDEVRSDKDRLRRLNVNDYEDIVRRMDNYISDVIEDIADYNNVPSDSLGMENAIISAARSDHSADSITNSFDDYSLRINPNQIRVLQTTFNLASQLPTEYFEAKPERVVGFDEVLYYIVPDQGSLNVLKMMEKDGAEIRTYTAGDEKDRLKVLNSLKDARFSREINTEQTETEAFKKWFGDWQNDPENASKVVNEDGTPKIMYRGDSEDFTVFDRRKSRGSNLYGRGFYFTDSETHAGQYGNTKAYYLDVKTPLTPGQNSITREQMQAFLEAVQENEDDYDFMNYGQNATVESVLNDMWGKGDFEMLQDVNGTAIGDLVAAIELFNEVNGTDYDGIVTPTETVVFNSNQIKSAMDNIGTFDMNNPDIRYSREITPEQDAEYMAAVESGDTEKQQRMVDEAARAAGAYTDEDGNPVKMYHGTDSDFTVFDPKRIGSAHNPDQYDEIFAAVSRIGYFATDNLRYAQEYSETGKTMSLYMIMHNPYEMAYRDFTEFESDDYDETVNRILDFKQELIEKGHDGIVAYTDDGYTEYIAFNNTQMKSAAPVTYDDDGNVIPPSQRFNPERADIRESRDIETASNADLRRMLRESEEKIDYLKKQWTARTAFGAAQAVKPEDFNKQVRRLKDMMKYSNVTTDEIRNGLRELYDIMERPLKGRSDTAEARWNEAEAKAEALANEWAIAAAMERVISPDIADNLETLKDIYSKLRSYNGFYIVPEMTEEAGDKESLRRLRKQLSFMHLLGVDSNKAGVASGRMSIDAIYTDLARSYPGFFGEEGELSGGELNGDYAKLQAIADVAGFAWEAAHDPYSVEQTVDEQSVKTQLKDDLLHSFFDVAVPTKASSRPTENDAREAYAQGQAELGAVAESEREEGYREGYNKAKFEDEGAVETAHMREDLMEQRFAEDAERFKSSMHKILTEREEKINRLEKRLIKRGWADRARIERNGVMRNLNKLNRLLENPTRKQHIPQGLRASTAKLLETVGNTRLPNGKTVVAGRMQQIQVEELEKMRNFAHEIQIGLTGAASAENSNRIASTEGFMLQLADKINALEDYYNRAIGPDVDMSLRTDDAAVTQNYGFLHSLNQILTMAVHALDDANQFTIQGKNYTAENLGSLLVGDLNGRESEGYGRQNRKLGANLSDRLRNMTYETMSADLFFGMMGDNWKNIVAHSYREGQNRQAQHEHQYIEYMKELLGDYDNMKAKRELIQITANGKPLNVTRSQLMQLYATYQRPAGRTHLENGGACFVDDRGNESRAYTVKITPEKFAELTSHLTDEDKRIADGLVKFMADECSEWGNDASMYMYGFRMYEDGSYIPLDVVNYAIPKEIADKIQKTKSIENASFTNPLKRNSVVPLRMTDIFDIANNHVRRMAAYNAYAPITNDMNRIMKLSDVSGTVQEKMGRRGYKYLQDFVQTVAANEVRNGEMAESAAPLTTAMNLYKRQAVAWNVSTMLKQPISIFRAANEIDGKYIRQALALGKDEYRRIKETMLNNSGVAYLKENGYSDVGLGKTMEKLYTKNYINDAGLLRSSLAENKVGRGLINAYDWMTEKGMAGAGRADESTWVRIWKACELEVAENHPGMTADEKLRLVTQRFNDVIGKTQVVDTVLDTAPLMRNKAMQIFTPFMNEPTKSLGGLVAAVDAVRNNKNGAKKALRKAIGLYALSNLLIEPLVTSFVSMWRDEKDDTENFWWSLLEKMFGIKRDDDGDGKNDTTVGSVFTSNVASGLFSFPVINIFYDTISNGIQGFGSEKIDVAALSNIVSSSVALVTNAGKEPDDRQKTMYRLWGDWAESIAAAAGVPAKTVRRQIAGTVRGIMDITNSDWAKWQYNKLYYNLDNASARSQKNFYDILASAYKRGDMETYEAMRKELGDIVTGTPSLVSANTIQKNIEKRGGEIVPGTDLWNLDVQSRFRLDTPVKSWKVENFLTGVYKAAEKEGVDSSVYDDVLLNMPSAYDYDGEDGEIEMTADQYDMFTRNVGSLSYKILSELSASANADRWEKLNIDQKLHAIQKVYAYAKAKNKKDINPDYNINGQGKWMSELYDKDPNSASAAAKAVLDVAKGYKETKKRAK